MKIHHWAVDALQNPTGLGQIARRHWVRCAEEWWELQGPQVPAHIEWVEPAGLLYSFEGLPAVTLAFSAQKGRWLLAGRSDSDGPLEPLVTEPLFGIYSQWRRLRKWVNECAEAEHNPS